MEHSGAGTAKQLFSLFSCCIDGNAANTHEVAKYLLARRETKKNIKFIYSLQNISIG